MTSGGKSTARTTRHSVADLGTAYLATIEPKGPIMIAARGDRNLPAGILRTVDYHGEDRRAADGFWADGHANACHRSDCCHGTTTTTKLSVDC